MWYKALLRVVPLANSFFNLGIAILIDELSTFKELTQIWFADDGLIYGHPEELKKVWSYINLKGKEIGYFPNSKSVIYDCSLNSKSFWNGAGLTLSHAGLEILGSPIGNDDYISKYCKDIFSKISKMVETLTDVAKSHPQQAWSVLSRSTKFKGTYIFRTTPNAHHYSESYNTALESFISNIISHSLDDKIILQAQLPIGRGGLGLNIDASEYVVGQYNDSQTLTYYLSRYVIFNELLCHDDYSQNRKSILQRKKSFWDNKVNELKNSIDECHSKRLDEMQMPGANDWVSCIPVSWKPHWLLSKSDYIDAMSLRFNLMPSNSPIICRSNNCSKPMTMAHMDSCTNGGIITKRHDYVKSIIAKYGEKAFGFSSVTIEPHLGELSDEVKEMISGNISTRARADIAIMDYNGAQKCSYFDVSIISPICDTHKDSSVEKLLSNIEKRRMTYTRKESRIT